MIDLDPNENIELDDGCSYRYLQQAGGIVRLANVVTGERVDFHVAELSQRLVGVPRNFMPTLGELNALSDDLQDATMQMAEHIQELLTGLRPGQDSPRPEYDLSVTSQNQRIAAKVKELNAAGIAASRATMTRHIRAYRDKGAAGLVDHRLIREDGPLARLDDRVLTILCEVIADQKNRSTGTLSRIIEKTRGAALKEHGLTGTDLPSDASFYRYIEILGKGKHLTGSAKTRQSEGNKPDRTFKKRIETLPGAEMQIDTNTVDLLVRGPSGTVGRPMLTILFDRATRTVVAHTIRMEATKGVDHALLLAQAFTPPQNRPDNSQYRAALQNANPQVHLLDPAARKQLELTRPFIRPEVIMMDNGRDYTSNTFIAAAEQLKVSIRLSAPHTPIDKGLVERMFGSIKTKFVQDLPGYVGRTADHRADKVEQHENLMDIYAFREILDDWILEKWNNRPHKHLRDRIFPQKKLTPNQAYMAATKITDSIRMPLTREQYIVLLPSHFRAISSTGVQVSNREYDSPELHPLRNTASANRGRNGKWEVKVDPYSPFFAWVRSPENTWIECQERGMDQDFYPHQQATPTSRTEQDRRDVVAVTNALAGAPVLARIDPDDPDFGDETISHDDLDELDEFDPNKE